MECGVVMAMSIVLGFAQAIIILVLAPLIAAIIKKVKARLQNRRGPGLLQVYYDLTKLLAKDSVISPTTSWLFLVAPFIYFASAFAGSNFIPLLSVGTNGQVFGDMFVLIYSLAIGRFFLALASLDSGSAFGGMGGSREMYISVLVEPALLLALLTVAVRADSSLVAMAGVAGLQPLTLSYIFAAIAFFIVVIAETGRIPVDNPDTHLELTMIHEGMVLEYSGRHLGLILWGSAIKQTAVLLLFVIFFLPWSITGLPALDVMLKLVLSAIALAVAETLTNKMRLFRVPAFLGVSCLLSLLALAAQ